MWLMCGGYVSVNYVIVTLSRSTDHGMSYAELKKKYTPPLMPDYGDPGWFQSFELGHQGYKVKDAFDPKWMSHPPVPLAYDVFVERAPWMHHMKDWESPKDLPK